MQAVVLHIELYSIISKFLLIACDASAIPVVKKDKALLLPLRAGVSGCMLLSEVLLVTLLLLSCLASTLLEKWKALCQAWANIMLWGRKADLL